MSSKPRKVFIGEKGFVKLRFLGWRSITIKGHSTQYIYRTNAEKRTVFVDIRDAARLLEYHQDGLKMFEVDDAS